MELESATSYGSGDNLKGVTWKLVAKPIQTQRFALLVRGKRSLFGGAGAHLGQQAGQGSRWIEPEYPTCPGWSVEPAPSVDNPKP